MANWWDDFVKDPLGGVRSWLDRGGIAQGGTVGYEPQYSNLGPAATEARITKEKVTQKQPVPVIPGTKQNFVSPPPAPNYMGMSPEELLAYLLGGSGGGGPDLSGYNALLGDIASRERNLRTRKGQQQQFLTGLFDAAEARATADREALSAAIEEQLIADAARRSTEIGQIQTGEAGRRVTADQARQALGVTPGADLSSQVAANAAGQVGATGAINDRDARILQSIGQQQFNREIANLTPAEQMAISQLSMGYEDRLAALASERAAIQAQIAQARASGRGGGPSTSEKLAALQFAQEAFGPGEAPELPGSAGFVEGLARGTGNRKYINDLVAIGDRLLRTSAQSRLDPTKPAGFQELLSNLAASDPAVASLLTTPGAAGIILEYVTEATK